LFCITASRDPFETADEETLLAFGRGHPALEYHMKAEFKWPSTEAPDEGDGPRPLSC